MTTLLKVRTGESITIVLLTLRVRFCRLDLTRSVRSTLASPSLIGSPVLSRRQPAAKSVLHRALGSAAALLAVLASTAFPRRPPNSLPSRRRSRRRRSRSTGSRHLSPTPRRCTRTRLLPGRALLVTDKGLSLTDDAGRTWMPLSQAASGRIGKTAGVAFSPERPDAFYLASDKGLWLTTDAGKTIDQTADRRRGLKSDKPVGVAYYQGDPAFRTLLVWYGGETPGASVSYDSGRSWQTLWPELFVHRFVNSANQGITFVLLAAQKTRPQVINALAGLCLGESLEENVGDILPTDAAASLLGHGSRNAHGYSRKPRSSSAPPTATSMISSSAPTPR